MKLLALTLRAALGFGAGAVIFDEKSPIALPQAADPDFDYFAASQKQQLRWMRTFSDRYIVGIQRATLGNTRWSYSYRIEPQHRRLVAVMKPMVEPLFGVGGAVTETRKQELTASWTNWVMASCTNVLQNSLLTGGVEVKYEIAMNAKDWHHIAVTLSRKTCLEYQAKQMS